MEGRAATTAGIRGSGFTVLIVEDDHQTERTMTLLISWEFPQATVVSSGNGEEGIRIFRESSPDLVIADLDLPVLGGLEMIGRMRAVKKETPVLVVSAGGDPRWREKAALLGARATIGKPYRVQELFTAMETALGETVPGAIHRSYRISG
ncbi:response regulator [Geomonas sp. Red32]|uniref:response regulator transcription factor n=1 Tax=Geomonas sp. Red32 TaxID=2912856 RepID=UPI00202CB5D4|nr:response regulator [Geomonas sp. Red32]MCM0083765.1 response regulator [Geomonas sp. Red32]